MKSAGSLFIYGYLVALLGLTAALTWNTSLPSVVMSRPDRTARVEGNSFPRTLTDAYGQRLQLHQPPQRIVSAMLATDEILVDLVPKKRIAAVTNLATLPSMSNCSEQVKRLPAIPGLKVEPIVKMQPDLVLAFRLSDGNILAQLRQCDVPVFCFGRFDSLAEIRANVELLGRAVGAENRADAITAWMDRTLDEVRRRCQKAKSKPRVLYYCMNATAGKNTVFDDLVRVAGGRNVAAEAGIVGHKMISTELVLALDPEVIILAFSDPELKESPWQSIRAVRDGRVYVLPARHLNCISHHVVKTAVDMGHALHPNLVPVELDFVSRPPFRSQQKALAQTIMLDH